ncbi:MAG: efflux RND transporter periplasmic adaptor subunit [Vicinamibacterales bacterium]
MTSSPRTRLGYALVFLASLPGCRHAETESTPVVPVSVAPVVRGSIRRVVTADAVIHPRDQASVTPKLSAPVQQFLVQRGDRVKVGQLLVVLEHRDLAAAAAAAKGQSAQAASNYRALSGASVPEQVTRARADVDAARQLLEASSRVLESRERLFKEGALARRQVDEARVAHAQAKAQLESAERHWTALIDVSQAEQVASAAAQVEAAQGQYEAATAQLGYAEIRSPIDGVVTDRPLYAGEMATAGTPLLTVMDLSSVVARASLSLAQARDLRVGSHATITPSDGGEPVVGRVSVVSPAVDASSTTVQVWVQADNRGGHLRPGVSARVDIVAETIDDALLVPVSAVLASDEGGSKVMVVGTDDIAHEKAIEVGVTDGGLVEVRTGVAAGDRVVTVGGLGLEDRAKVAVSAPGEGREPDEDDDDEPAPAKAPPAATRPPGPQP